MCPTLEKPVIVVEEHKKQQLKHLKWNTNFQLGEPLTAALLTYSQSPASSQPMYVTTIGPKSANLTHYVLLSEQWVSQQSHWKYWALKEEIDKVTLKYYFNFYTAHSWKVHHWAIIFFKEMQRNCKALNDFYMNLASKNPCLSLITENYICHCTYIGFLMW